MIRISRGFCRMIPRRVVLPRFAGIWQRASSWHEHIPRIILHWRLTCCNRRIESAERPDRGVDASSELDGLNVAMHGRLPGNTIAGGRIRGRRGGLRDIVITRCKKVAKSPVPKAAVEGICLTDVTQRIRRHCRVVWRAIEQPHRLN